MNKKIVIIFFSILIILILSIACTCISKEYINSNKSNAGEYVNNHENEFTNKEIDDMQYVDDKLSELMGSENYKKMSLDNKKSQVEKLLDKLRKDKYIKNVNYDNDNKMFSFEYSSGAAGGVMLKEFDPTMNGKMTSYLT